MSLEGYKPLDLSFLNTDPSLFKLSAPVDRSSIVDQILANTNWDMPTAQSLDAGGNEIKKKKTIVGRVMDALSVGNYATSDFLLGALKGHQESNSDNPLEDVAKMALHAPEGAAKGVLASLKGTFGTADVANDPTDKNHFGDVLLNASAGGREALDPNSDMDLSDRKKKIAAAYIGGTPFDLVADPLNLVGAGEIKGIAKLFKAGKITEEAAEKAEQVAKLADVTKIENKSPELVSKSSDSPALNGSAKPPVGAVNNFDPETFDFITRTSKLPEGLDAIRDFKIKKQITPEIPVLPKAVTRLGDPKHRNSIATGILKDAIRNGNWDSAKAKLRAAAPGLDLTQTTKYLNQITSNPRSIEGLKRIPKNSVSFISAMDRVLEHDFKATGRAAHEAAVIPKNTAKLSDIVLKSSKEIATKPETIADNPLSKILANPDTKDLAQDIIKHFHNQIAGDGAFPGLRNPEHYKQALASGKTVKWSGPKQVNMWQTILNRTKFGNEPKYIRALKVLKGVEHHFMHNVKAIPYSASKSTEAIPLKLSDILEHIGTKNLGQYTENLMTTVLRSALAGGELDPKTISALDKESGNIVGGAKNSKELIDTVNEAIENARIVGAVHEANTVKKGIDAGATAATTASNLGNSEVRVAQDINMASKTASDITKKMGGGPTSVKMSGEIIKQLFTKADPIESAISRGNLNTKTALTTGKLGDLSNVKFVTNAIKTVINSPAPETLGRTIGPPNRALDWLGARFNAAYKNADMRPIYLAEAATARSSVAKRSAVWNNAVRRFGKDPDMWNRAMKMAQGSFHSPVGSPEEQLSKLILSNIENLVGSSGLRTGAELENNVAGRAQLLMPELNANLLRYGIKDQFISNKVKDFSDTVHDFSEGADWLHSWEVWDIKDPVNFMMRMHNAVENTVREANMFNEIASRWGVAKPIIKAVEKEKIKTPRVKKGEPKKLKARVTKVPTDAIDHPRFSGYTFTPEHANQIRTFMKNLEDLKRPNSKLMRQFDNVLSKWKASVTIYMPSHHIRNMIGDTYMNWLAGVNTARPYSLALKVMKSQKGRYDSIEDLGNLTSPSAMLKAIERASTGEAVEKGTNTVLTMKKGMHVTNDMIYTAAFQNGLLPGARVLEDLTDDSTLIQKFRPLGGKGQAAFQYASEYREHAIRLAHFIDMIKKSPKDFPGAVADASAAVRKWHPDGMDMTSFERNVMKRVFPFYSWTRKAFPLIAESLVMAPGKTIVYPKIMGGLSQGLTGGQGTSDPFPEDQLFPNWIKQKGIGPIMGSSGNYNIINPSNPSLDLLSETNNPSSSIGQMLNPLLRIPAEELTKTDVSTGAPITSQLDYLTKQLPGISTVGRVTNTGLGGPIGNKQSGINNVALINLLTALGIIQTGSYQKEAQYEQRGGQ